MGRRVCRDSTGRRRRGRPSAQPQRSHLPQALEEELEEQADDLAAEVIVVTKPADLYKLYSKGEIGGRLGLPVLEGRPAQEGEFVTCVWKSAGKAVEVKGGRVIPAVVTITRADATQYATYKKKVTALAKSRKASGVQVVRGVGDEAYAIGASVKGVPIWYGGTRHGDRMTAVEMSGGRSKAGVVAVTELLLDILERGCTFRQAPKPSWRARSGQSDWIPA